MMKDNSCGSKRGLAGLGLKLAWSEYGVSLPLLMDGPDFNKALEGGSEFNDKPGVAEKIIKHVQKYEWYIFEVKEGSPAFAAGLQVGDQILKIDGKSIVGVTAKRVRDIWKKTGTVVELEVAK